MRRFLQILFILLLLTAGIGGRYLYNRGLTKSWREWVVQEVRKHGVEVSFARLTVRPFRGLVAKDVKIYDSPARNRVIAHMNEMVIEANYANIAKRKPFLDALTLVDTSVRIPLDAQSPFGPSLRVEKLNARVLFPADQVQVTRLDANIFGINIQASGNLLVPPGYSLAKGSEGSSFDFGERVIAEMNALQFDAQSPRLAVRFSGDLAHPEQIVVEADLSAATIRRGRYALTSLALSAVWRNKVLLLQRLNATDAKGRLQASGSYDPASRVAELRFRSNLDLPAALRTAQIALLDDFTFPYPPRFDFTARVEIGNGHKAPPKIQVLGHAGVGSFFLGGVPFESLSADVSWDGHRWAVRNFALRQESGDEMTGDAQQDYDASGVGDFRMGLKSSISPQAFASLLPADLRPKLALAKFHDTPRLTLSARGPAPGPDTLSVAGDLKLGRSAFRGIEVNDADVSFRYNARVASGELKFGRTLYRGVEARNGETSFRFDGRVLALDQFEVNRSEGSGKGSLSLDLKTGFFHLSGVRTSVFPAEVALWIDPELVQDIKPYRFGKKPPSLKIDGTIDPRKNGTQTKLTVIADAPGGMDYTFVKKDLHFSSIKGNLFFTDERLKLSDVRGELFGGAVNAEGDISILKAKPEHIATIKLAGVDFSKLSKLYFGIDDSHGRLDGECTFTGKGDEARTLRGDGEISITEGNVFAIPFLGPFSEILSKMVPGMGYSRARKATATFSMADGIITNKDLQIVGNGFSMFGAGRIWMVEDRIDYDVRINARGLPGVVLFPVSKLLEYRAESRFSKPDWRLRVVPRLNGNREP